MSVYNSFFDTLGLRDWCDSNKVEGPMTMEQLLAKTKGVDEIQKSWWEFPFPSLDALHESCSKISRTRDMTSGLEQLFLDVRSSLKLVLDPLTQPLSWILDSTLYVTGHIPWWVLIPILIILTYFLSKSKLITSFVGISFLFLTFIDHYSHAIQTLSIIFVCTCLSVLFGLPMGILMSRYNRFRNSMIPFLDMLQTLPSFVYLIPLILLFSVTESKLYGIAIMLYAIVPLIRLTDLGIRLVDPDVIEASDAYGLNYSQTLLGVKIPLALPNIMAGVNQTIMMALAMVVIASLVSAPGLGVLVLKGIRNLELGVGLVSGFCIVLIAVILDRISKASLERINVTHKNLQ